MVTLALSKVCSLQSPFERDVEDYAAGKCPALEVWLTKLEDYLRHHSAEEARVLLERHEMAVPVASYQGGLFDRRTATRQESWNLFARRLELCQRMEIGVLVIAGDISAPVAAPDIERVLEMLRQAAALAGARGVRLALEFQAGAALANNLQTAAALVRDVDHPYLGICLDAFHFCVGPSKTEDLGYLTNENLFHVQLCDLADTPRELATDADRILPGDGDMHLDPLLTRLREMHYQGPVAVELMNPRLWQVSPLQFGEVAITALRRVLEGP